MWRDICAFKVSGWWLCALLGGGGGGMRVLRAGRGAKPVLLLERFRGRVGGGGVAETECDGTLGGTGGGTHVETDVDELVGECL